MISIIVRTKNEERWIRPCLTGILSQKIALPVQIVLVDNNSTDATVARAKSLSDQIVLVEIEDFIPGLALNEGIRASDGDYIVCLSAHCPPVDDYWLHHLLKNLEDPEIAGVYGRQIPTPFSSAIDKRDLLLTFGLDKRTQIKDTFFHNANSMLTRKIWDRFPFDEVATNIEDRLWGKEVISSGYKIIYEPDAAVFHHHGIHQNNRSDRAQNVIKIIESNLPELNADNYQNPFDPETHDIAAIIPMRSNDIHKELEEELLSRTLEAAKDSKHIKRVLLATDSERLAKIGASLNAEVPFLRPKNLSEPNVRVDEVLKQFLFSLEGDGYYPDIVVPLEMTYPLRPRGLIDGVIERLLRDGFDTVVAGFREIRGCWRLIENDEFEEIIDSSENKEERQPLHMSFPGLACATWASTLRKGGRLSGKLGIFEIDSSIPSTEIRSASDLALLTELIKRK